MQLNIEDRDLDVISYALQELPLKVSGGTWDRLRAEVERARKEEAAAKEQAIKEKLMKESQGVKDPAGS